MPLSKRINNLHLTNHQADESHHGMATLEYANQHQFQNHLQQQIFAKNDFNNNPNQQNGQIQHYHQYNPSLNEAENPHYYNRNKILYELYMDRERRLLNDGLKRSC